MEKVLKNYISLLLLVLLSFSANADVLCLNERIGIPIENIPLHINDNDDIIIAKSEMVTFESGMKNVVLSDAVNLWGKVCLRRCNNFIAPSWIIEFPDSDLDQIDFYIPDNNGGYSVLVGGEKYAFEQRDILYNNTCFSINLNSDEEYVFYFRIKETNNKFHGLYLYPHTVFINQAVTEYHLHGIFVGASIIMLCVFLIMAVLYKRQDMYIFLAYLLGLAFCYLTKDNIGFHYLWDKYPFINQNGQELAIVLMFTFLILFVRKFLELGHYFPMFDSILIGYLFVRVVVFTMGNFYMNALLELYFIDVITLVLLIVVCVMSLLKGNFSARLLVVGLSLGLATYVLFVLRNAGFIGDVMFIDHVFQISLFLQMLFFAPAFLDKISWEVSFEIERIEQSMTS